MTTTLILPAIRGIEFINGSTMFVHLYNDKTFIVPLDKFPAIQGLTMEQKHDFEIIDDNHLSFLAIDEVFTINELLGI